MEKFLGLNICAMIVVLVLDTKDVAWMERF